MKRNAVFMALTAIGAIGLIVGTPQAAESYRRWRHRTGGDMITGEYWGRYRRAYTVRSFNPEYYVPTSTRVQRRAPVQVADPYAETRSNNGVLAERQVYKFRETYADGQSRQAMRSALGEPSEHTLNKDRWKIARIGIDGKPSGEYGYFEADYGLTGWNPESKTVKPPKASW